MARRQLQFVHLAPWIKVQFARAAGPGGQNVNKVNTRVTLLLDFATCPAFSAEERARLRGRLARRLSRDGRLRVVCQSARTQRANRQAAEGRLLDVLARALHVAPPRRATRPTGAARERRLTAKRQRGATKQQRQQQLGRERG